MKENILYIVKSTWVPIKEYIKDYKLTSIFFSISIISFITILFVARNDLKFDNGNTSISFIDEGSIYKLQVMTEYISPDRDKLSLSFCVDPNGRDKFDYSFYLSNNLVLVNKNGDKIEHIYTPPDSTSTIYRYSFSKENHCMRSTFSGNIYGEHSFDKNLDLSISFGNRAKFSDGTVIIFTNRLNISNLYPMKYNERRAYVTEYYMRPNKYNMYSYVLQGQDQSRIYENQLKNFDIGILLGILLSIITGVIIDFSFFYDKRKLKIKKGIVNEN